MNARCSGSRPVTIIRELHRGELFLLADTPRTPLCESENGIITISESHAVTLPTEAIEKVRRLFPSSLKDSGSSSTVEISDENLLPAGESTTETQKGIVNPQRKKQPKLYYNVEVACPASNARKFILGTFNLGATDKEERQALKLKNSGSDNAWFSATLEHDDTRQLYYKPDGSRDGNLGVQKVTISNNDNITAAKEAYIPVTPAVQIGEHLGFPSSGYFYHFLGTILIHEYKIQDGTCTFSTTNSRAGAIDHAVRFRSLKHFILLFWRIKGQLVKNQYLLFKSNPLDTFDLACITEDWLQNECAEVDINALLNARNETIKNSTTPDLPAVPPRPAQHYKNIIYKHSSKFLSENVLAARKEDGILDIPVWNIDSGWEPVPSETGYPVLLFETRRHRYNHNLPEPNPNAADLKHGDEDKETIEKYGYVNQFKHHTIEIGDFIPYESEDLFSLPATEHFRRMRGLGESFSISGETKDAYKEMVDKFERNEGGSYSNPKLNNSLKKNLSTELFKGSLITFLEEYLARNATIFSSITDNSYSFMANDPRGKPLPQYSLFSSDLFNGGVLCVHGIYAMEVFLTKLEQRGQKLKGNFSFKIQDHFGLDSNDINHSFWDFKPFESFEGFQSWYLLQHYSGYNYTPFTTVIDFTLDF